MGAKRVLNKVGLWAGALAGLVLTAAGLLLGAVQTDWGRGHAARLICKLLQEPALKEIRIQEGRGFFPVRFRISRVALVDGTGEWLFAEGLRVAWSPLGLLAGRIRIGEIHADVLHWERLLETEMQEESKGLEPLKPPSFLWRTRLEQLTVKRLSFGEWLLGERAEFEASAKMARTAEEGVRARILLERVNGPTDRTAAELVYTRAGSLKLEASIEEGKGGILAVLAGLEGPIRMDLRGQGPPENWSGTLGLAVGDWGRVNADIILKVGDPELRLDVSGALKPSPTSPSALRTLIQEEARFSIASRLSSGETLRVDSSSIRSGPFSLNLSGSLGLKNLRTEGEFALAHQDLSALSSLTGVPLEGKLNVQGNFDGGLPVPRITLSGNVLTARVQGVGAERVEFGVQANADRAGKARPVALVVKAEGYFLGLSPPELIGPVGERLSWKIDATWRPPGRFQVGELRLECRGGALDFAGRVDLPEYAGRGRGSVRIPDLQTLADVLGVSIPLGTETRFDLEGNAGSRALSVSLKGSAAPRPGASEWIMELLKGGGHYEADLKVKEGRILDLSAFRAGTGRWEGQCRGSLDLEGRRASGALLLTVPDLSWLSPMAGFPLQGGAVLDGTFQGPLSRPEVQGRIALNRFLTGWLSIGKGMIGFTGATDGEFAGGDLGMDLETTIGHVAVTTHLYLRMPTLDLRRISVRATQGTIDGDLVVNLEGGTTAGAFQSRVSDLGGLLGSDWGGRVELDARLSVEKGIQSLSIRSKGDSLRTPFGTADEALLEGKVSDPRGKVEGSFLAKVRAGRSEKLFIRDLELEGVGGLGQVRFEAKATGRYLSDFQMDTAGVLWNPRAPERLELSRLNLKASETSLYLVTPLRVEHEKGAWRLQDLSLRVGGGDLRGSARIDVNRVWIDTQFYWLPLNLLRLLGLPPSSGRAGGRATMEVTPKGSIGSARLRVTDFAVGGGGPIPNDLMLAGNAEIRLSKDRLRATLDVEGLSAMPLKGHLDLPLVLRSSPFSVSIPPGEMLSGGLTGEVDIAQLLGILGREDEIAGGRLELDLRIEGPPDRPTLQGKGRLLEGFYESPTTGTLLRKAEGVITGDQQSISLDRLTGTDGEQGSISIQGRIYMDPARKFPFEIKADLQKTKLLRMDEATAACDGSVTLSGDGLGALLSGSVQVGPAELRIPDRLPPEVPEIEVIELWGNRPQEKDLNASPQKKKAFETRLDVALTSPGRVFLRGRGLESEWQGSLAATGTNAAPALKGTLSVVRGQMDFLGKRFTITRGEFFFDGSYPPSPFLDLEAQTSAAEITARLKLSGRLLSLDLHLTSEPQLPKDELLSRLLFGRSVSDITPYEAISLAGALLTLTGGAPGVMDRTRQTLGIDRLEVRGRGSEAKDAVIGAGKYLADGIYVEVERGLDPQSSKASVQVDLTPQISFQSEVGANSEGGVGLRWRWNY
jgi:translocation and assembly module TamB